MVKPSPSQVKKVWFQPGDIVSYKTKGNPEELVMILWSEDPEDHPYPSTQYKVVHLINSSFARQGEGDSWYHVHEDTRFVKIAGLEPAKTRPKKVKSSKSRP